MKLLVRVMLLLSIGWIGYANFHLLGAAADAMGKTSENVGMKMQMLQIGQMLQMEYVSSNAVVTGDLLDMVRENVRGSGRAVTAATGRDIWGTPYFAVPSAKGVAVCSAGADRKWNTRDDVRFEQSLLNWGYKPAPIVARTAVAKVKAGPVRSPTGAQAPPPPAAQAAPRLPAPAPKLPPAQAPRLRAVPPPGSVTTPAPRPIAVPPPGFATTPAPRPAAVPPPGTATTPAAVPPPYRPPKGIIRED